MGPPRSQRAGPWPVQLRHQTRHTSEQYVTEGAWRQARLEWCPLHPGGGCGFARHGTYPRRDPAGMRVARWYCRQGRMSFSLLPDCLCSRFRGSLDDAERVVVMSEAMGVEAAAQALRVDEVELPGVLRWLGRRRRGVRAAVLALVTAMPGRLGTVAEVGAVRSVLGTERALWPCVRSGRITCTRLGPRSDSVPRASGGGNAGVGSNTKRGLTLRAQRRRSLSRRPWRRRRGERRCSTTRHGSRLRCFVTV